ncbi:acyl carrier protein [Hamadaea tsunoensis]|uniref:acyl carrier protein n=1 Tax=Hamadaea tsunoensis TaxID=53368 RepID=UPI00040953EE|nr:acyl carrier protein [Hamadaea tsunoensis]
MSRVDVIRKYIVGEFAPDIAPDRLAGDYDLLAGGVVDSLGLLKVISFLEREFGLPVDDLDLSPDDFRSIDEIDAFVARHTSGAPQGEV